MGCCGETEREGVLSIKKYSDRSCTDILFLLLFILSWGATAYLTQYSIDQGGNPDRVIYGTDMYGRVCGKSAGVKDQSLAAWPYPPEFDSKICVSSCLETQTNSNIALKHASTEFLFYCIPSLNATATVQFSGDFTSLQQQFTRAIGDLYTAWWVIAASPLVAILFSFLYLSCTKRFASMLVWGVLFILMAGGAILGYVLLQKAKESDSTVDPDRVKAMKICAYISIGFATLLALVVFSLRDRIKIAIEIIKEASRAVTDMPCMILFPLLPFFLAIIYMGFWIIIALYLYSVAKPVSETTPSTVTIGTSNPSTQIVYQRDTSYNNAIAYHFFNLLWNIQFLVYFAFCVIAGAVADWYFSARSTNEAGKIMQNNEDIDADAPRSKVVPIQQAWNDEPEDEKEVLDDRVHSLTNSPVCSSCKRVTRFHLGTVAFGALIIAIINFVRAVVKYIEEKSKNRNNRLQKAIFCCIQCCLKCLHCCADKISKNAFVWCSIWGDNFMISAASSFKLLWNNLARVAALNVVGAYLIVLGKILVALMTSGTAALVLLHVSKYKDKINSPVFPCLVVFFLAYFVSAIFMVVYETSIDTIFLCFLVDSEYNKNGMMMASDNLRKLIQDNAERSRRKAQRMKEARGEIQMVEVQPMKNNETVDEQ